SPEGQTAAVVVREGLLDVEQHAPAPGIGQVAVLPAHPEFADVRVAVDVGVVDIEGPEPGAAGSGVAWRERKPEAAALAARADAGDGDVEGAAAGVPEAVERGTAVRGDPGWGVGSMRLIRRTASTTAAPATNAASSRTRGVIGLGCYRGPNSSAIGGRRAGLRHARDCPAG